MALVLPFLGLLAQNGAIGSKRCDHKELRKADGLVGCSSLDFQFDPLSATEIKAVAKAVSSGEIRVFICRGCEIGAAGMEVLGPALLSQDSIDFLTLREDTLGASGANYVAQLLNQSKELSGLDLRGAGLEKDNSAIAAALRHPDSALEILNLKVSGLGAVGAAEVAAALAVNKELQWLDLSFTSLGDEGAAVLAASLAERDEPLSLHLEDKSVGEEGLAALNRVKKEHPRHEVLLPPEMFKPQHRMPRRGRPSAMDSEKMQALGAAAAALDPDGQIKTEL